MTIHFPASPNLVGAFYPIFLDKKELNLSDKELTHHHLPLVIKIVSQRAIKILDLSENQFKFEMIDLKSISPTKHLTELNLSYNRISKEALTQMAVLWPGLKILNLTKCKIKGEHLQLLADSAEMSRPWPELIKLDLSYNKDLSSITPKGLLHQMAALWPRLKTLKLARCGLTGKDFQILTGFACVSQVWPELKKLNLSYNEIEDESLEQIIHAKLWPRLQTLKLIATRCSEESLKIIAGAHWDQLNSLELTHLRLKDPIREKLHIDLQELVKAKHLSTLTTLNLSCNQIHQGNGSLLTQTTHWTALTNLNISDNYLRSDFQAIAQAKLWSNLTSLNLSRSHLDDADIQSLAAAAHWDCLAYLQLAHNWFGSSSSLAIAQASHWKSLTSLDLSFVYGGRNEGGLDAFSQATYLTSLNKLDLSGNNLKDDKIAMLETLLTSHWRALKTLNLKHNQINKKGLEALTKIDFPPSLKKLSLVDNKLEEADGQIILKALKERENWRHVTRLDLTLNAIEEITLKKIAQLIDTRKEYFFLEHYLQENFIKGDYSQTLLLGNTEDLAIQI